jgi:WD40 repeat protein
VLAVAFAPDGATLVTGNRDGAAYLWDTVPPPGASHKAQFAPASRRPITRVRVSADGKRLMAQDLHFHQFVWDVATREPIVPDGGTLTAVADDGATALLRLPNLTYRVQNLLTGHAGAPFVVPGGVGPDPEHSDDATTMLRVVRAAFSPDRALVAVIDARGRALVWRAATGELVGRPIGHAGAGQDEPIRAVAFSPDGTLLLTQSVRGRGVWNAATTAEEHFHHNPVGVQLSRFSPCGRLVLESINFSMAQVWDVERRTHRPATLLHGAQVWGLTASADAARVVTASYDRTARVWDAATGKPLAPPFFHEKGVSDVVYSPDGKRVLTGSWDWSARLWLVPEPVPDEVERVTVWAETMTGLHIGPTGSSDLLTAEEWNQRKRRLDELGGPPWTHIQPAVRGGKP